MAYDMESVGSHGNIYDVEHLATFQLSEELAFPADGMRRLLHMEKNGFGIWSQKMRIRLEHRYIVIVDFENGDEMERFPLQLIRDPTAFTNPNPGELYNNIFAFIVHPVEMHIFQCFNISAADIVEDVKMALSGRLPPNRHRHGSSQQKIQNHPPAPVNPPQEPAIYPHHHQQEDARDDASSVGSEGRYEREVAILNRCFDDIERFIARLQYAAAAYRELQRRRKSKKSKKKDHGEGLLSMRARPPHEREFVDILQKFKLSFNLLARLKSHIHDPNAPELVHFLFTPLALIVDASRDAHAAGLASRVVSPLLTREAIELLNNCLTSKETELWHSLGDAWSLSREQWKGYVALYQPVFMDGWSPTIPESNLGAAVAEEARLRAHEIRAAHEASRVSLQERETSTSPVEMMHDDFSSGQRAFLDSVRSRGGRVVVVTHPRTANNHKELTVIRGEYLEVLDDSKKWWKARNWRGQIAHVPHTIVSPVNDFPQVSSSYHPHHDNGRPGQWSSPSSSMSSDDDGLPAKGRKNRKEKTPTPPPPPPAPPVLTPKAPVKEKQRPLSEDLMHQELRNVLTLYREKKHIEITRTPEVYINQFSSAREVKEWLEVKGFSERCVKQCKNMDGNAIFSMSRAQMEEYFGPKEGRRLDSQITISRNISGYKTARSSELRAILAKARAKVEHGGVMNGGMFEKPESKPKENQKKTFGPAEPSESIKVMRSESPPKTSTDHHKKDKNHNSNSYNNSSSNNNNKNNNAKSSKNPSAFKSKYDLSDDDSNSTTDDSSNDDGKSTLGRMLKQKRGEIFRT